MKESLTRDQFRLYQLIWKRFAASRMQPAKFESTSVKIGAGAYQFSVSTSKVVFEGFRIAYVESDEEKMASNLLVKGLDQDSVLTKEALEEKQHFTQPPAHYTEAALVKTLEEKLGTTLVISDKAQLCGALGAALFAMDMVQK